MKSDSFGDRMKEYESGSEVVLLPLVPICVRLDGKCFHNFTRGLARPYDKRLSDLMVETTKYLVEETNALIGYTQSDEISLIIYTDRFDSEVYLGGRHFKLVSILAAKCSVYFNRRLAEFLPEKKDELPVFDCRVWCVPNKAEACNTLLWREKDATRNSIQMAGQSLFSHNELHGKSCDEIQEMMWQEKKINWNNYPDFFKRGTYVRRRKVETPFTKEEIDSLPPMHNARTNPELVIVRHVVETLNMPVFTKIVNREGVVFDGEEPRLLPAGRVDLTLPEE